MKKKSILMMIGLLMFMLLICACQKEEEPKLLSTPKNLKIDGGILSWDKVKNADAYIVYEGENEYQVTDASYEFYKQEIDADKAYFFSVQAIKHTSDYLDSEISAEKVYQWQMPLGAEIKNNGLDLSVFGTDKEQVSGKIVIPSIYQGKALTAVDSNAFSNCKNITEVYIAKGIEEIGNYAFEGCTALTGVYFAEGITKIDSNAFYNCEKLTELQLPNTLTTIGNRAFSNCRSLQNITLPEELNKLSINAFENCAQLEALHIPAKVSEIEAGRLIGCDQMVSLTVDINNPHYKAINYCIIASDGTLAATTQYTKTIPAGVTKISAKAFYNSDIKSIEIPEGVTEIGFNAFAGSGIEHIELPASVKKIDISAFHGCKNLKSVTLNEGLTTIGMSAFNQCSALEALHLPATLTDINVQVIQECTNLKALTVADENPVYKSQGNCLFKKDAPNILLLGCAGSQIPSGVTVIGEYAFAQSGIQSLVFPEGIEIIKKHAFNSARLSSVTLPSSLKRIEKFAFYDCYRLSAVNIPANVEFIGQFAFGTNGVLTVILPSTVGTIEANAFDPLGDGKQNSFVIFTDCISFPARWATHESLESMTWYGGSIVFRQCEFSYDNGVPYVSAWNCSDDSVRMRFLNSKENEFIVPTRAGYTFAGWALTPNGASVFPIVTLQISTRDADFKFMGCINKNQLKPYLDEGVKFYALWVKNE